MAAVSGSVTIFHWIVRRTRTNIFLYGYRFHQRGVLIIASHLLSAAKVAAVLARFRRACWLFPALAAVISLAIPATAWGDIFKWTDAQGRTNFSNVPPTDSGKAKNVEIVLKETRPTSIQQHVATPTEQALLARIESLERELRNRQYATQAPPVPPPAPYGGYYPPTPTPPPPSTSYYGSGYASYPGYYPTYYYSIATSYAVYPARAYYPPPAYVAPRGGFSHAGGGHGGRGGRR